MITKRNIARGMMATGSLVYLLGIWRTCPLFSGKGYFLGVLVMGMFAVSGRNRTTVLLPYAGWCCCYRSACCWSAPGMYRQTGMKKPSISRHGLSAYMAHRQPPNGPASPARCKKRNKRRPEARKR